MKQCFLVHSTVTLYESFRDIPRVNGLDISNETPTDQERENAETEWVQDSDLVLDEAPFELSEERHASEWQNELPIPPTFEE